MFWSLLNKTNFFYGCRVIGAYFTILDRVEVLCYQFAMMVINFRYICSRDGCSDSLTLLDYYMQLVHSVQGIFSSYKIKKC